MPFDPITNTSTLCRVCMVTKEGHRTNIYEASALIAGQPSLHGMLKAICAPVFGTSTAEYPPGMPAKVCATCRNAIIAAFKLYQTCIETDQRLRKLLGLNGEARESEEIGEDNGDPLNCNNEKRSQVDKRKSGQNRNSHEKSDKNEDSLLNSKGSESIKVEELELIDESGNEGYDSDSPQEEVIVSNDEEERRACKICNKECGAASMLRKHMKQQHQLYMCEFCHETFGSYSWYAKHKLQHKSTSVCKKVYSDPIECSECGRSMANTASLRNHLQTGSCTKLNGMNKMRKCSVCNAIFPTRTTLAKHRQIHKEFKCAICGKSLVTKQALQGHLQRHSKYKPFPCEKCSKRFYMKGDLKYHMLFHHQAE